MFTYDQCHRNDVIGVSNRSGQETFPGRGSITAVVDLMYEARRSFFMG